MKKIWDKYKTVIIIGVFLILFVVLSFLLEEKDSRSPKQTESVVSEWVEESSQDEYTLMVLAGSQCPHCNNFKPIYESVTESYGIDAYWFEVDKVSNADYVVLSTTYDIESDYQNKTPFTVLTRNGVYLDGLSGYASEEAFVEFLKTNNVIE